MATHHQPASDMHVIRQRDRAAVLLQGNRPQILSLLRQPGSATGLAKSLKLSRQRVNYHLRALERAGFVELVAERRARNCVERVMRATAQAYVISPEVLAALSQPQDGLPDRYASAYLVGMAAGVIREVAALRDGAQAVGKRLATLSLESEIAFESAAMRSAFAEELAEAIAQLTHKYHRADVAGGRHFKLVCGVYPKLKPSGAQVDTEQIQQIEEA